MTINKSRLMKTAWELRRKYNDTMSKALKLAWEIEKNLSKTENQAEVKEWFACKLAAELNLPHNFEMTPFCKIKETEKAVYTMLYCGYSSNGYARRRCAWIPKSCLVRAENLKMIADYDQACAEFDMEARMYV